MLKFAKQDCLQDTFGCLHPTDVLNINMVYVDKTLNQ